MTSVMSQWKRKYIGDKAFYHMVLVLVIPMIVQKGVTSFVNLLDNIMVGKLGTEQVAGVAIANQLMLVFNLCIFGAISGVGIFTAQYFGSENYKGVRDTFQLKLIINSLITVIAMGIYYFAGGALIHQYLLGNTDCGDIHQAFRFGKEYMRIILIGLLPFAWSQCLGGTLREGGETVAPMIASIAAVFTDLVLNAILIFGLLGAPALGSNGAAIATVIARFVELGVLMVWVKLHKTKTAYFKGVFREISIPAALIKKVIITGTPLMINETFWATAQALMNQFYSSRGLEVVTAISISSTISNLFYVIFYSLGDSIAIIVGQQLGMNDMKKASDTAHKMIFFSVGSCFVVGLFMIAAAPLFPKFYNTAPVVRDIARQLIILLGICMPIYAYEHATYFTIRSGGKTVITFIFDSVFAMCVNVPFVFLLSHFTNLPIIPLYAVCQSVELIKCTIGHILVKKGVWLQNIVNH